MNIPMYLACPECQSGDLIWREDLPSLPKPFESNVGLQCQGCSREYPFVDNVWVMWSDSLKKLQTGSVADDASISEKVKAANIQIYDEVSEDYGEHHDGSLPYADTLLFLKAIADDYRTESEHDSQRVLVDVGCATGIGLDVGSNSYRHRVGVDISLANLKAVAKKGHTPVLADAEKLPFKPQSVDQMTCFATLHHFPEPEAFVKVASASIKEGGVLMIAGEPTHAASRRGVLADWVWRARKPVYRILAKYSNKYHLHQNKEQQEINDLAEFNRVSGGFSPEQLDGWLAQSGFNQRKIFYGIDPGSFVKFGYPGWKMFILKALSFQNPLRKSNWANMTAIGKRVS